MQWQGNACNRMPKGIRENISRYIFTHTLLRYEKE